MSTDNSPYELEDSLAVRDANGCSVLRIVLGATFYIAPKTDRELVRRVLKKFYDLMVAHLKYGKSPATFEWSALDAEKADSILSQLTSDESVAVEIGFKGGQSIDDACDFSVSSLCLAEWETDPSYLKFCVPITFFADRPDSFEDFVIEIIRELHPLHGYGGLMFSESANGTVAQRMEPTVFAMAQRFIGVEVDRPFSHLAFVVDGIKSVNWLTFFDRRFLDSDPKIEEQLTNQEALSVRYQTIGNTFFVRSGLRPQLGDTRTKNLPDAYIATAKSLSKIMITKHRNFHSGLESRFNRESSEAWLRRFTDASP